MWRKLLFCVVLLVALRSSGALQCYNCTNCLDANTCRCETTGEVKNGDFYCSLTREFVGGGENVFIKPVPRNVTNFYVYEPFYLSVEETITFDSTNQNWTKSLSSISFGCQTDRCNRADLLKQLSPRGFALQLSTDWLTQKLTRPADLSSSLCHECPDFVMCSDDPDDIDLSRCVAEPCATRCDLTETFNEAESTFYCFQSFCEPEETPNAFVGVTIRAVYYLRREKFELIGIDVFCEANDCSDVTIFRDIRNNLKKDLRWTDVFRSNDAKTFSFSTIFLFSWLILLAEFYSNSF